MSYKKNMKEFTGIELPIIKNCNIDPISYKFKSVKPMSKFEFLIKRFIRRVRGYHSIVEWNWKRVI